MDGARWIPGWKGRYEATRSGDIISYLVVKSGRPLVPYIADRHGHRAVYLFFGDGNKRGFLISNLVLATFVGPRPPGLFALHGPRGMSDDALDNLSWGTQSKNIKEDRIRDGTHKFGELHGRAKLSYSDVIAIREFVGEFPDELSNAELGKIFGVSRAAIYHVVKGLTWMK